MSEERKTCIKMFTISEYEEEEQWLRGMARSGWMLKSTIVPCFYFFERCEPQDIVFKLEFRSQSLGEDQEYFRMLEDFGWKYLLSCNRFRYFYKTAEADERSNELFSDNASKLAMVKKILISRMLPIAIIFLCCVLPSIARVFVGDLTGGMAIFWVVMLVIYVRLFGKIFLGFYRLTKKYRGD